MPLQSRQRFSQGPQDCTSQTPRESPLSATLGPRRLERATYGAAGWVVLHASNPGEIVSFTASKQEEAAEKKRKKKKKRARSEMGQLEDVLE